MHRSPTRHFHALKLSPPLLAAVAAAGYEAPSPLQAAAIPPILAGQDLVAIGPGGAGKTLAFVLPLLDQSAAAGPATHEDRGIPGVPHQNPPRILVLTPSGTAAVHIAELFFGLAQRVPNLHHFHVLPITGGDGQVVQLRQLERGVQVVVGTPRWLLSQVDLGRLSLAGLRSIVLDCADDLLRMGFHEDIDALLAHAPATRQLLLFATQSSRALERLIEQHLPASAQVQLAEDTQAIPLLRQRYWPLEEAQKLGVLIRLIEVEARFNAALVFVHTQTKAHELAGKLAARGYAANSLDGETSYRQSERIGEQLVTGKLDILIATDATRDLGALGRISHLIHYDLPCDVAAYRHRLERAPAAHSSLLLVTPHELHMLHSIEHATGQRIEPLALPERPREH